MLREYQQKTIDDAREAMRKNWSVLIQGATGSGKSIIFTSILSSLNKNKKRAWVVVPRTELMAQSSKHLLKWGVPHGMIKPNSNESRAYNIHVVSKDTLIRRLDIIKNEPDFILWDECHIAREQQVKISKHLKNTRFMGFSATPEIQDGRGLSKQAGGIYDTLIEGESIPYLMERGFLSTLRYFSPPIKGLETLKRRGTEYDAAELQELLERRKVYGEAVEHYKKHADGKPAIVFCRDVKSAYETADRFTAAGYKFFCIEGRMSAKQRKGIIEALTNGEIDGITNCELCTYGLDVPRVEVGIILRPTQSRALYMQMVGRILRPFEGKENAMIFDHVNNLIEHQEAEFPGIPLHYVPHINWNFHGKEKRKKILCETCKNFDRCELDVKLKAKKCEQYRPIKDVSLKLCPECFLYFEGATCPNCGHSHDPKERKELDEVADIDLKEIKIIPLKDLPAEEKREYIDRINANAFNFEQKLKEQIIDAEAVADMIKCADELGYGPTWIYWKMVPEKRLSVNVILLEEIARQKDYKTGWVHFQKDKIKEKIKLEDNNRDDYARSMGFI